MKSALWYNFCTWKKSKTMKIHCQMTEVYGENVICENKRAEMMLGVYWQLFHDEDSSGWPSPLTCSCNLTMKVCKNRYFMIREFSDNKWFLSDFMNCSLWNSHRKFHYHNTCAKWYKKCSETNKNQRKATDREYCQGICVLSPGFCVKH